MKNKIANVGHHRYSPSTGQRRPIAQIEGYCIIDNYYLSTPLELKGKGITFLKKYTNEEAATNTDLHAGWNQYKVTLKAFDKLKEHYAIMTESLAE
jgi:hypothetical protein